jgi:hypothetical protein
MPHLPKRADRDALIKKAAADPTQKKRVQLWDYFFRINPDAVGRPQKKEIAELDNQVRTANARYNQVDQRLKTELDRVNKSLAHVSEELRSHAARTEDQVRQKIMRGRTRNMALGIVSLGIALVLICVSVFMDAALLGRVGFSVCGGTVGVFVGLIGAAFLLSLLRNPEDQIAAKVEGEKARYTPRLVAKEAECNNKLAALNQQCKTEVENFNGYVRQVAARIQFLRDEIGKLVRQIPTPATDQDVEQWFREDLAVLRERALDQRGLRERLISIDGCGNPINIYGPVELQDPDTIPPPFKAEGSDRNKHMQVRRFVVKPDGGFVAFHGVYNVEYVLVANDVLFTYGTTWDLITGEQSGERADEINYTKITQILTLKSYREIQTEEGKVAMENAPSLTLNLENGKSYVVTFPDLAYFKATNAPNFDPDNWESDQSDAVKNIINVISEQKRIAQNLLTS